MSVTLPTASLLGMLADLLQTTDDDSGIATGGIVLATAQGTSLDGVTTLLAGTSTRQSTGLIGHCHEPATGSLPPVLLPGLGARLVLDAFKPVLKEERQNEIQTFLRVELDGPTIRVTRADDLALWEVESTEDQVRTKRGSLDKFPQHVWSTLGEVHLDTTKETPTGRTVPAGVRRTVPLDALKRYAAVARRRGAELELFTPHPMSPVSVGVGLAYRGLIPPPSEWDGIETDRPAAEVHEPVMPARELSPVG